MKILLSNDDGIEAPGLAQLEAVARRLGDDIWVIAPDRKHTAASHRLTCGAMFDLLRLNDRRFACTGSPADCVVAAMTHVFSKTDKPDLLLSGINDGRNVAQDIAYSGTLAVAREAAFWDIPAIGLSRPKSAKYLEQDVEAIANIVHGLVALIPQWHEKGYFLGVNLPDQLGEGTIAVGPVVPGDDKIASRSEVEQAIDGHIRLMVPRGRSSASTEGDQNAALAAGKVCVMRYDAFSQAALPTNFMATLKASMTKRAP